MAPGPIPMYKVKNLKFTRIYIGFGLIKVQAGKFKSLEEVAPFGVNTIGLVKVSTVFSIDGFRVRGV
jgi:hypothetical protein